MLEKQNSFEITGRLTNTNLKPGTSKKTGNNYISGSITVESIINEKTCTYEINLFSNELTSEGKISGLYTSYSKLNELIGKKVEVYGSMREHRYFDEKNSLMKSSQRLEGRFISGVKDDSIDTAVWELGGFIVKTLTEKQNKAGEIYRYDLNLAQANYNDTNLSVFTVHINPKDREIIEAVKNFNLGSTIRVNGILDFTITTETRQEKVENGFGKPMVRVYTNNIRNFFIQGGNPSTDTYDAETRTTLVSAYKAKDVEIESKVKSNAPAVETQKKAVQIQTSLI